MIVQNKPIVGGEEAQPFEFPHAVHIDAYVTNNKGRRVCGGVLISPQHILTAAHCLNGAKPGDKIRIGYGGSSVDLFSYVYSDSHAVHPEYNSKTLDNDIAVVHLPKPLRTTKAVYPIPIYTGPVTTDTELITLGWGTTNNDPNARTSSLLHKAQVRVGRQKYCQGLRHSYVSSNGPVVCAGPSLAGRDACYGDSGGPLVMTGENAHMPHQKFALVGLTSYGERPGHESRPKCGMPDGVGYYTHVSYYMDFVRAATNLTTAELIDPSSSIKMAADDSSAAGFALQQTITRQCMHMYLALLVWLLVSRFLP